MTRVILVRHGETDWNATRRAQGHADVPLNHAGRAQALDAARELSAFTVDAVYSSDLMRALDTAKEIARLHGLEVVVEPRFREIDQGEWTGLTSAEIRARWPGLWGPERHRSRRPGGESPAEVRRRALAALAGAVEAHPDGTVVVVSHGGTIRWLSAAALGLDDDGAARIRGLRNGAMVSLDAFFDSGELRLCNLVRFDGATAEVDDPNV